MILDDAALLLAKYLGKSYKVNLLLLTNTTIRYIRLSILALGVYMITCLRNLAANHYSAIFLII